MNVFDSMRVFVQIVEKGSLNAAAHVLGMSATMVGKHLKGLEQYLETQLLHRTTRRQSLTLAGDEYYQHCKQVLELVAEGEGRMRQEATEPSGTLRISAPEIYGTHVLMPFIATYLERYPTARIDLSLTDRLVDVINDDIDVVLRIGTPPDSTEVIARPLAPYRVVLCASPQYLAQHGEPLTPEELAQHQCLSLSNRIISEWTGDTSLSRSLKGPLVSDSSEALRQAALQHMGIVLQSHALVGNDIRHGKLNALLENYPLPEREVNVIYPVQRYKPARLSCFLEEVVMLLGR